MNRLKKINYLNDVFYPASVCLMESFWFFPWLLWLGVWNFFTESGPAINLFSVIILLVVWPFIDRGPERRIWKRPFAMGMIQ